MDQCSSAGCIQWLITVYTTLLQCKFRGERRRTPFHILSSNSRTLISTKWHFCWSWCHIFWRMQKRRRTRRSRRETGKRKVHLLVHKYGIQPGFAVCRFCQYIFCVTMCTLYNYHYLLCAILFKFPNHTYRTDSLEENFLKLGCCLLIPPDQTKLNHTHDIIKTLLQYWNLSKW
jgi:hypothetical protein